MVTALDTTFCPTPLLRCVLLTMALSVLLAAPPLAAEQDCQPVGGIEPYCGLQAPEDLEFGPDGRFIIYGEFGGLPPAHNGRLMKLDLASMQVVPLYPGPEILNLQTLNVEPASHWGDASCPGEPAANLAPHGIYLSARADGAQQLLVVNHGGRESIEFFELLGDQSLQWRGCVMMPKGAYLNDVVALPNGGFVATHMMEKDDPKQVLAAMGGQLSGHLWHWAPGQVVNILYDYKLPFPNGIQITSDGKYLLINIYSRGEVRKIELASGELVATAKVPGPDNSNWSDDGRLLVASHTGTMDYEGGECRNVRSGYCPMAFQIVAIDIADMSTEVLFSHQGAPMGAGTAALKKGDTLYIGSFAGDRIVTVDLTAVSAKIHSAR